MASMAMTFLLVQQAIDLIHQGVDQLAAQAGGNHRAVPLFRQALEVVKELSSMDWEQGGTLVLDFVPLTTTNDTLPWTAVRVHYSSPASAPPSNLVVNALSAVIIYHLGLVYQMKNNNSAKALALYQQVDRLLSSSSSTASMDQQLQSLVWNNLAWMVMWNVPEDAHRRFHGWNRWMLVNNERSNENNRQLLAVMAMVLVPSTAASAAAA